MKPASALQRLSRQEQLNFLLTNRVPRALLTQLVGHVSRSERPLVRRLSMALWRRFSDLDLSDALTTEYRSLHACFTRQLKAGARPIDPDPALLASPCDAIVGACGNVLGTQVFQAKGAPYLLDELLRDEALARRYRDGCYATLRLTSSMYHRFHAPHDGRIRRVTYIAGDVWNVNPPALKRVGRLFCKNERAVIPLELAGGAVVTLVPVAAILVASIRLHFIDVRLHLKYRGPNRIDCDAPVVKGQELGWFEHGSTILVFAPRGFELAAGIAPGQRLRMGQALMRLPAPKKVALTPSPSPADAGKGCQPTPASAGEGGAAGAG
jgi:phosphatidylserine decarboxylase